MNDWDKAVAKSQLDDEKAAIKALEKHYRDALHDIEVNIKILSADTSTQSRIYQLQYQKAMRDQISAILQQLHTNEFTTIEKYLETCYQNGFVGTMYSIAKQGMPIIVPINQDAVIRAAMTNSKLSAPLYESIGMDMKQLKKTVTNEITRGIANGSTWDEISNGIEFNAGIPRRRAQTIARTEGHRVQQEAAADARNEAKERGCDVVKQWDSTLDGNTRPSHRQLDGQIRETDKPFEIGTKKADQPGAFGRPEEDINCRCVALTRARWGLDEDELKTLQERAEFFGIDKKDSFDEFKEKYIELNKMASSDDHSNNWAGTQSRTYKKDELSVIVQYAKKHGVNISSINHFDGDADILKSEVRMIQRIKNDFDLTATYMINIADMNDADFGQTKGSLIHINKKAMRNAKITVDNMIRDGKFSSTSPDGIAAHEMGHIIAKTKGNIGLELAQKAYYNTYGDHLSDKQMISYLMKNVSKYSVVFDEEEWEYKRYSPKRYKEIIPEVLAKDYTNGNEFTTEFVRLLKEK